MGYEWLAGLVWEHWEGLRGLGKGCEWLAGLASRALVVVPRKCGVYKMCTVTTD